MIISNQALGTTLVVLAAMTFAVVALIVKKDPLPLVVATEARFFVAWLMSVAFMFRYRDEHGLSWFGPANIRWLMFGRGFLLYTYVTLWWASLPMAPLGDCIAIMYCDPLLTVIWSRVILGEKLLWVFPLQVLFAATGMLLIVKPPFLMHLLNITTASGSEAGNYTLVFIAMFASSWMYILTHQTKSASWIEVEHVTSFLSVFVLNPIVYCVQQAVKGESLSKSFSFVVDSFVVDSSHVGLIVLASVGSFVGVAMQTRGYQLAEPGKASMFSYLEVPFAYFLQCVGTSSGLDKSSIIGAFLVIISCVIGGYEQWQKSDQGTRAKDKEDMDVERLDGTLPPGEHTPLMGRRRSWALSGVHEPESEGGKSSRFCMDTQEQSDSIEKQAASSTD